MGNLQIEAISRVFVIVSPCWLQRDGAEDSYDAKIMTIISLHRTRSQKGSQNTGCLVNYTANILAF